MSGTRREGGRPRAARRARSWAALAFALALGLAACGAPRPPAEGVEWQALCLADSIGAGDPFVVEARGLWPAGRGDVALAWDPSPDTLLVAARDSTALRAPEGWSARAYRLTLLATRAGRLSLPPFHLVASDGETLAVATAGPLRVGSRLAGEAQPDLRPLAPLVSLRGFPWWLVGVGALLLAAAAAVYLIRRRRRRWERVAAGAPPLPPEEEFRLGAEALVACRWMERGEYRAYAQELSWVLRRYLGRRWERPALEATRPEIVGWLPATRLCVRDQGRVAGWLEETDRIKFAGEIPLSRRAEELLAEAREIVDRTEEIFARESEAGAEAGREAGAGAEAGDGAESGAAGGGA